METSLQIEQVTFGGRGLARLPDGRVCFVPWVIPGERVRVRITREKKSFVEADLAGISEASVDRVAPPCPVFGRCGGCQYQHMTYDRQLAVKRDQVADVLRRLGGGEEVEVEPTVPSPRAFGYRNRITVHARRGAVGFFAEKSRDLVDVTSCPIATEEVNRRLGELRQARPRDGEYALREPGEFRGFRQVNDFAAGALLDTVDEMAGPGGGNLIDAYCGAGFFAARLRSRFARVTGIEWSVDAVRRARETAGSHETYRTGDVARELPPLLEAGDPRETTVLVDPPSEGLAPEVATALAGRPVARLVYVSCNPATLARDLKTLRAGYRLVRVRPIDMFPQTAEIEVATLLEPL